MTAAATPAAPWSPPREAVVRWVLYCAVGEVMGLAAGALWYVSVERIMGAPEDLVQRIPTWFFLALSGLLEGAVLGSLQAFALRRLYPSLSIGLWINVTIALSITGWAIGAAVPTFIAPAMMAEAGGAEPSIGLVLTYAAAFGALVGLLFGAVQSVPLARAAAPVWPWLVANAAAWALAMPIVFAVAGAVPEGAAAPVLIGSALGAGLAAGLTLGLVTAFALAHMRPKS